MTTRQSEEKAILTASLSFLGITIANSYRPVEMIEITLTMLKNKANVEKSVGEYILVNIILPNNGIT